MYKCFNYIEVEQTNHFLCSISIYIKNASQLKEMILKQILKYSLSRKRKCRLNLIHRPNKCQLNCTLHLILFFSLFVCYRTPSNEELFERFLVDVAWRHYRTYVTKGSTEKLSRGTGSTKSMWLANYLVTNALLRDKRGRLAVKERLKEIQERHHRKTEDEEDDEENKV